MVLKMAPPQRFRRAISVAVPLFSALLFWGWLNAILEVGISTNILKTGITVGFIFGALNFYLAWLAYKHQVP
jgi:hypothetical protein